MEAEAKAFFLNLEAEAETIFFSKKLWQQKRKRIFFQKNFGSGSGSFFKINRFQNTGCMEVWLLRQVLSVTITVSSKSKGTITTTDTQRIRSDWRTLFILFLSALRLILAACSNFSLAFWSRCGAVKRSRDCFDCSANFFEGQPCFVMLFFFLAIAFLRRNPFMMIPNLSYDAYFFSNLVINLTASICNSRLEWAAWKIRLVRQLPRHW